MTDAPRDIDPENWNRSFWGSRSYVKHYVGRSLRPVEVMVLVRYRDELRGRVVEIGCGAGRLTSYLVDIASEVHGVDLSPSMIEYCRRTLPQATFHRADMTDLSGFETASFDTVIAPYNVLDVLDEQARHAQLGEFHRLIRAGGLLVLSSHNRDHAPLMRSPAQIRAQHPVRVAAELVRLPRRMVNRRRLLPLEEHHPTYAILNDSAHDYSLLHYYISRDQQERQLAAHEFELIECLDLDGRTVARGESAADSYELHYVARSRP